jgi:hypothetical protein
VSFSRFTSDPAHGDRRSPHRQGTAAFPAAALTALRPAAHDFLNKNGNVKAEEMPWVF